MMPGGSIEQLQEELLASEAMLARIRLENTTPVIIGGYNARPYSVNLSVIEDPRPTEIKGVWRWWARALVSGALYLEGVSVNIAEANELISHVLGGSTRSGKLKPSKVIIDLKVEKALPNTIHRDYRERIVRLKLLGLGAKSKDDEREHERELFTVYDKLKLVLNVYKYDITKSSSEDLTSYKFALASLLLSLLFSGMGAITTRAFGSLKILPSIELKDEGINRDKYLAGMIASIDQLYKNSDPRELDKAVENIISSALNIAKEYVEKVTGKDNTVRYGQKINSSILPKIPSITLDKKVFHYKVVKCSSSDPYTILEKIGKATLKQTIARSLHSGPRTPRASIHTFILGLPRFGRMRREIGGKKEDILTGYVVPARDYAERLVEKREYTGPKLDEALKNIDKQKTSGLRRVSAVGFTVLDLSGNKNYSLILVYSMLSDDFNIIKGSRSRERDVKIVHRSVYWRGYSIRIVDTPLHQVNIEQEFRRIWDGIIRDLCSEGI